MATLTLKGKNETDFTGVQQALEYGRSNEAEKDALEAEIRALRNRQLEELPLWETIAKAISAYRVFPRLAISPVRRDDLQHSRCRACTAPTAAIRTRVLAATITLAFSAALSAYMGTGKK